MDITKGEVNKIENKHTVEDIYNTSCSFEKTNYINKFGGINQFQKDRGTSNQYQE